jgi:hypothetical protein
MFWLHYGINDYYHDVNDYCHGVNNYGHGYNEMTYTTSLNWLCNHVITKTYMTKVYIFIHEIIDATFWCIGGVCQPCKQGLLKRIQNEIIIW